MIDLPNSPSLTTSMPPLACWRFYVGDRLRQAIFVTMKRVLTSRVINGCSPLRALGLFLPPYPRLQRITPAAVKSGELQVAGWVLRRYDFASLAVAAGI